MGSIGKRISLDDADFILAIAKMQEAANCFEFDELHWSSQGEKSDAFDEFVEDYETIMMIIKAYINLMKKDIEATRTIRDILKSVDSKLGQALLTE